VERPAKEVTKVSKSRMVNMPIQVAKTRQATISVTNAKMVAGAPRQSPAKLSMHQVLLSSLLPRVPPQTKKVGQDVKTAVIKRTVNM